VVNAGATVDVSFRAVGGISLVQDALMFACFIAWIRPASPRGRHDRSSGLRQRYFIHAAV
jgi:hypothetical protein